VKFGTVIADPPWNYGGTSGDKRLRGYSDQHYKPLTTEDLASLPLGNIVTDDAVLFLWTNGPFLVSGEAQRVAVGWGFTPVTLMYWNKTTSEALYGAVTHLGGVGYWFRGNCEPILVAKRKKSYRWAAHPDWDARDKSALFAAPKGRHSSKPDHLHDLIERSLYPKPYLELFGRRPRDGWTVVGGDIPLSEDIRDSIARLEKE
jgi:N6-adenosine-specific RNA methylase IME4